MASTSGRKAVGFVKADSNNLPNIHTGMILRYMAQKDIFNAPEMRGVKEARSSREEYGDSAVGYVAVNRDVVPNVIIQGKICPEHRVHNKLYPIEVTIDEQNEVIVEASCHGCQAQEGGCKHVVAFMFWLLRRSEEPSRTSVACYWKKPMLATVGSTMEPITLEAFGAARIDPIDDNSFLRRIVSHGNWETSLIHQYFHEEPKSRHLGLHSFLKKCNNQIHVSFQQHASILLTDKALNEVEKLTRGQNDSPFWHAMRYGRITASKFHEAAHCKTKDGSLVSAIIGAAKLRDTAAMARGRRLEGEVIKYLEKKLKLKTSPTGLFLSKEHIWLGATPDALSTNYVIEVKCPVKDETIKNYIKINHDVISITPKYMGQIQLQMHLCKKKKAMFCVADPGFEKNECVYLVVVDYDEVLTKSLIEQAGKFWHSSVYPRLIKFLE